MAKCVRRSDWICRADTGIAALFLTLILSQSSAPAAPLDDATRQARLAELRARSAGPVQAGIDSATGRVRTLSGRFEADARGGQRAGSGRRDEEAAAREFLSRHAELFGLRDDLEDLALSRRSDDRGGAVLAFEQRHRGVPVFEGMILVGFDPGGAIRFIRSDYVPDLSLEAGAAISRREAIAAAEAALGAAFSPRPASARLVIVEGDKDHPGHHAAWEIAGFLSDPLGDWHLFVDAGSGEVIRRLDMLKSAGAACVACDPSVNFQCGLAFHHDPVSLFGNPSLRDIDNVDSAQQGCILPDLVSAISLDGQFANTSITANRAAPPYNTPRSLSQQKADEVNVYYHANRAKVYLGALGFPAVMNFSIGIDAHDPSLGDNAHYVPSTKILEFGEGGVDDAQDPSIVYHEYGHAIQDNQVPGFGSTLEGGSMGEGFGDYWGASLTEDASAPQLGTACVGPWDATAYNPYTGALGSGCLRRTDGTRQYPRDLGFEVHDDGEIWSAALWRMRGVVNPALADALVIKGHSFLTPTADFLNGADALLAADSVLNGGANSAAIHQAMAASGIPRTATPASSNLMTLTSPFFCESTHPYQNFEYRECRFTQPGASRLRIHFASLETESGFDFVRISDAAYRQVESLSGSPFGNNQPGFSVAVAGDTIVARFKADPSIRKSGFIIDQIQYVPGAGSIPDGSGGAPESGLTIDHAPGGSVTLSWNPSCAALDTDYGIYEGSIADFSSHAPLVCGTGGMTSRTFTPGSGDVYFLVVPRNAFGEGSYGRRSDGSSRTPSASACLPQEVASTCL